MYSLQFPHGGPSRGAPALLSDHDRLKAKSSGWKEFSLGRRTLRVLSVGDVEHDRSLLTRLRWPRARTLIIRSGMVPMDRTLYEQRLHLPMGGQAMVERILNLLNSPREEGYGNDYR